MNKLFKKGTLILFIILFVALIIGYFLGIRLSRNVEGFSGAAKETINNMYSANVIYANSIYSISVSDSKSKNVATFYTNPQNVATLSNITSVTFYGQSQNPLWNSSTATIAIDNTNNIYTITCVLTDKTSMTFVGPYESPDTSSSETPSSSTTPSSTPTTSSYDNYNHFDGSSYPTTFYGPNGGSAKILKVADSYSLVLTNSNGTTTTYTTIQPGSNTNSITQTTYYGPNGGSAVITSGSNGQYVVKVINANGTTTVYYPTNTNQESMDVNNNSTSSPPDQNPTPANWQNWANWFNNNTNTNANTNAGYTTGPNGSSAGYATGPNGNTIAGTNNTNNTYSDYLPQGISSSMIPPGQEDLYILKSEVVPPVCPVCPNAICPASKNVPPPCPACARCPEPSFECKKVPNYNSMNNNSLPQPVVNKFSTFGM